MLLTPSPRIRSFDLTPYQGYLDPSLIDVSLPEDDEPLLPEPAARTTDESPGHVIVREGTARLRAADADDLQEGSGDVAGGPTVGPDSDAGEAAGRIEIVWDSDPPGTETDNSRQSAATDNAPSAETGQGNVRSRRRGDRGARRSSGKSAEDARSVIRSRPRFADRSERGRARPGADSRDAPSAEMASGETQHTPPTPPRMESPTGGHESEVVDSSPDETGDAGAPTTSESSGPRRNRRRGRRRRRPGSGGE